MESLSILIMNWRDIQNPEAGGAEVYTHEIARRLVTWGDEVTLVTSRFPGAAREQFVDGVRVVRVGNKYAVYRRAKQTYLESFRDQTDVVIDEINTIPFRTTRYVDGGTQLLVLIHQIARESWNYETPFPVNVLGRYWLENRWLRPYRGTPTITVSQSAKEDLMACGFRDVSIVPEGISVDPLPELPEKEERPTFLFAGRLKRVKLPDHAIRAFARLAKRFPAAQLWILGDGYLRKELERTAPRNTVFFGRVPESHKLHLMRRAHVLMYPAVREGWGLSVTEANAMGTPAVGYDVPGLRDSIRHGDTGLLVRAGDIDGMAEAAGSLIANESERRRLALNALRWAREFSWAKAAGQMREYVRGHLGRS